MPYSPKQCRLFAVKEKRGEKVPSDWKEKCKRPRLGSNAKTDNKTKPIR